MSAPFYKRCALFLVVALLLAPTSLLAQRQYVLPDVIGAPPDSIEANWGPADTKNADHIQGIGEVEVWNYNRIPVPPGEDHTLRVVSFYLHADSVAGAVEMLSVADQEEAASRMHQRQPHVQDILGSPDRVNERFGVKRWQGSRHLYNTQDVRLHESWKQHPQQVGYEPGIASCFEDTESIVIFIVVGAYHFNKWAARTYYWCKIPNVGH